MTERKCKECGAILEENVAACSQCGCPVEQEKEQKESETILEKTEKKPRKINIMAIVSLVIGLAVIFMGVKMINTNTEKKTYSVSRYSTEYATFGGDFYTYIYKASDTIVDELNDINNGMGVLYQSIYDSVNAIYYPIGMVIVSIGLGISAVSLVHLRKE